MFNPHDFVFGLSMHLDVTKFVTIRAVLVSFTLGHEGRSF